MAHSPFRAYVASCLRDARHDLRATVGASADRHTVNRLAFARAWREGLPSTAREKPARSRYALKTGIPADAHTSPHAFEPPPRGVDSNEPE